MNITVPHSQMSSAQLGSVTFSMPGTIGGATQVFLNTTRKSFNKMHNNVNKIGFIGLGFVGSAIANVYVDDGIFIQTVKIDPAKGFNNTYKDLIGTDGVFVSVPSPQGDDGSCDTSTLEGVLDSLKNIGYTGVVISKCTAPPAVYTRLQAEHKNLVHAPEFLTAANAQSDYVRSKFAYIGGEVSAYRNEAERIIKLGLPDLSNIIHCTIAEASLAKYTLNTFLATKVIFMNEIAKLSEKLGCDYNTVARMVTQDNRIGSSHMQVPGPDGFYGFGGMCFPKDTSALLKFAEEAGTDMMVLDAAVKKNTLLRLHG